MQVKNNPKFVILLIALIFGALLAVALYSPAYVTAGPSQNSTGLTVIPVSFLHVNNPSSVAQNKIPSENYTGLFYVQHVCTYRQ
ncbi:MAG TPA: hypothetical protein VN739_04705 [Nitrososphaerales archaeon]|nr:hypothetical protein [Nitrososphaerales archaeon]